MARLAGSLHRASGWRKRPASNVRCFQPNRKGSEENENDNDSKLGVAHTRRHVCRLHRHPRSRFAGGGRGRPSALSIEDAIARVKAKGYTDVEAVERDRGGYEIEARDSNGAEAEVFVDAETGDIRSARDDD